MAPTSQTVEHGWRDYVSHIYIFLGMYHYSLSFLEKRLIGFRQETEASFPVCTFKAIEPFVYAISPRYTIRQAQGKLRQTA